MGGMTTDATTAWAALGQHVEVRVSGRVEWDDYGIHITDPQGRRWNLQYDDPVTLTTDMEAAQ